MKAVVPAAGRGSRLRPKTDDRPKALVTVGEKPLLSHVFETIEPHVSEYVVVIGYRGEQTRDRFGSRYNETPITYVKQPNRDGLASAVQRAESIVEGNFIQLNGDNVLRGNVDDVIQTHENRNADATLLVQKVSRERAMRGGVLSMEGDTVKRIVEKPDEPPSRLAVTGCFAFSPKVFDAIASITPSARGEYELPDAIEWLARNGGTIETVDFDGWRVNVNTEKDIASAEARLDTG